MQPTAVEYGTLWVWEPVNGRPPSIPLPFAAVFQELSPDDIGELTTAMAQPNPDIIEQRLANNRRCFLLRAADEIITYGWVTHGPESVGELERRFHLQPDEAYIWDCGTIPARRGRHCYSALLSYLIHRLHAEGVPTIWIGASRLNQPSVQGIANAGFQQVIDLTYRRFFRLTLIRFQAAATAPPSLVSAAARILFHDRERRVGPLVIGYKRPPNVLAKPIE